MPLRRHGNSYMRELFNQKIAAEERPSIARQFEIIDEVWNHEFPPPPLKPNEERGDG